jgi:large subunit ribosomal protein L9
MKIILTKPVVSLGKTEDIIEVSDGYARNYLIPRGLAVSATPSHIKERQERMRAQQQRTDRERHRADRLQEKLAGTTLVIEREVGEEGKLFGSVTTHDIAQCIESRFQISLDHRKIVLDDPIRVIGMREVTVKPHSEVEIRVTVEVKKSVGSEQKG